MGTLSAKGLYNNTHWQIALLINHLLALSYQVKGRPGTPLERKVDAFGHPNSGGGGEG